MLNHLRGLFAAGATATSKEPSEQLATALLLIEMARADFEFAEVERTHIETLLAEHFGITSDDIVTLMTQAREHAQQATSLYDYVKVLNQRLLPESKLKIMELLWRVAHADGHVDKYEEHLLRKLADLLYVSNADYIQAKLMAIGVLP
jgi:uncharacterized tellurite resistance protein B-like protein